MPIVAVVAAVAVDAGLATGAIALTAFTAVAAIGATTAAVGAVTGNKTLEEIGGALGLVGGIGAIAVGSGAAAAGDILGPTDLSDDGAAVDTAAQAATDASPSVLTSDPAAAIADANNPVGAASGSLAASEGNAAAIDGQAGTTPLSGLSPDQLNQLTTTPFTQPTPTAPAAGNPFAADAQNAIADANAQNSVNVNAAMPPGQMGASAGQLTTGTDPNAPPPWLTAWQTAQNKQLLTMAGIQSGLGLISGLTNPLNPAQINALNAQAAANNAAATLSQKQAANVSQPLPTVGQPTATSAVGTGLINNKPVAAANVTGAPNTAPPPVAATQVTGVTA